jgi:hypothetical protein
VILTAQDIEIAVARHFDSRVNLIVPNVHWGWDLRHEADMIVLRPSGYCDEVEIKTTRADIRADLKKRYSHWESRRIARVWFAVPYQLAQCPEIPAAAGILSVMRGRQEYVDDKWVWIPWRPGDSSWTDSVTVVRPARLRPKAERQTVTDAQRVKLAELGAMRIWDLKATLAARRKMTPTSEEEDR